MNTLQKFAWLGDDLRHEVSDCCNVKSIEKLSIGDITHLAQLSRILETEDNEFATWFVRVLHHEIKLRKSEGAMERGLVPVEFINYTDDQLGDIAIRLDCLRDFPTLTPEELTFVVEIHRKLQFEILSRMKSARNGGVVLLSPKDMIERCRMTRGQIAKAVKDGKLPKPKKISQRLFRWVSTEVSEAIQNLN